VPLYDFRCRACGAQFEALVREGYEPVCRACGATDLERLTSGISFSVKSGGGLSPAARRDVQRQQRRQHADQTAFQQEIEKKHLNDD
jgi:putative FmdB family regulatory protein